jgi:hypothetical protein
MNSRSKAVIHWTLGHLAFLISMGSAQAQPLPVAMTSEAQPTASKSFVLEPHDFDRSSILSPEARSGGSGFHFLSPSRFSMHQSYSMNFSSGNGGSYSSGLYLNTLSYQLATPLILSMDIGFHSPIYNSFSTTQAGPSPWNGSFRPSLVLPRIGLDYKPTEHTQISLQLINGNDAWKAYGSPFADGLGSPFWRGF